LRLFTHPAFQGIGLAVLYLILYIYPLIEPSHGFIYHLQVRPGVFFVPILICIAVLTLFFGALIAVAARLKGPRAGRLGLAVVSGLLLGLPVVLIKAVYIANGAVMPHWLKFAQFAFSIAAWLAITFLLRPQSLRAEQFRQLASTIFSFASLSGIVVIVELLVCFYAARNIVVPMPLHAQVDGSQTRGRVIWIVLDELSYQQVYERRFPGLQLPAFDNIAAQSVVFTHVRPAGDRTDIVLPSLISGIRASEVRSSDRGLPLLLRDAKSGKWQTFHPWQTVFADALAAHHSTAVVGWYVPYCRILAPVLDSCFSSWSNSRIADMAPHASVLENAFATLSSPFRDGPAFFFPSLRRRANAQGEVDDLDDYKALAPAADRELDDSSKTFLLIHMPIPHPGAFYDRRSGRFITHGGSYIDALAFADKYLGHVRQLLQERGDWDSDTLVIMGDHSWRTRLIWRGAAGWTKEDEAASLGGTFDDRPGYIVKLPHEDQGARIDAPMDAMRTRPLLDALLTGKISTPSELSAWVAAGN
jgi:hypothetical protein